MHWTADEMKMMGMSYAQMRRSGLNFPIMQHFGFSLQAWAALQLDARDIEPMSDVECVTLFGLPPQEVKDILSCSYKE